MYHGMLSLGDKAMFVAAPGDFLHLTQFMLKQPRERKKTNKKPDFQMLY